MYLYSDLKVLYTVVCFILDVTNIDDLKSDIKHLLYIRTYYHIHKFDPGPVPYFRGD